MDSGNKKLTILLTGFEPFGGEKVNPSMKIVKRLSKRHFQNIHIKALILPVSYEKSTKVLEEYYKNHCRFRAAFRASRWNSRNKN